MGFMAWLQRFMMGRNGVDQLSVALMVAYMLLSFLLRIGQVWGWWAYLPLVLLLWAAFRMLSRNIPRRQKENAAFARMWSSIRSWWYRVSNGYRNFASKRQEKRTHKFFKCPACKAKVRVPKGKGKIRITCPQCGTKFEKKT